MILPDLQHRPVLTAVLVGLLAGVCEELLFRGPLQTALARRLPEGLAVGIAAFLFAAAHMDAHGLLYRTLLGLILGWIVLRGGSIFPAMLMHAVADTTSFAYHAWMVRTWGPERYAEMASRPNAAMTGPWTGEWIIGSLAVGAVLLLLGGAMFVSAQRRKMAPVIQPV